MVNLFLGEVDLNIHPLGFYHQESNRLLCKVKWYGD